MKKVLKIFGIFCAVIFSIIIIVIIINSFTSKKLVCKSEEGNITIYYTDKNLTGYAGTGIGASYDIEEQKKYASEVGIDAYIEEFSTWFSTNTSGSCK